MGCLIPSTRYATITCSLVGRCVIYRLFMVGSMLWAARNCSACFELAERDPFGAIRDRYIHGAYFSPVDFIPHVSTGSISPRRVLGKPLLHLCPSPVRKPALLGRLHGFCSSSRHLVLTLLHHTEPPECLSHRITLLFRLPKVQRAPVLGFCSTTTTAVHRYRAPLQRFR